MGRSKLFLEISRRKQAFFTYGSDLNYNIFYQFFFFSYFWGFGVLGNENDYPSCCDEL